jgi:hypothetical protein
MLFRKIIFVFCENQIKYTTQLRWNEKDFNVRVGGAHNYTFFKNLIINIKVNKDCNNSKIQ